MWIRTRVASPPPLLDALPTSPLLSECSDSRCRTTTNIFFPYLEHNAISGVIPVSLKRRILCPHHKILDSRHFTLLYIIPTAPSINLAKIDMRFPNQCVRQLISLLLLIVVVFSASVGAVSDEEAIACAALVRHNKGLLFSPSQNWTRCCTDVFFDGKNPIVCDSNGNIVKLYAVSLTCSSRALPSKVLAPKKLFCPV
jgi:hypothetical protein